MAASPQDGAGEAEWTDCLGQSDASELDNSLFFDYEYSIDQLMEVAGLCVAQVMILGTRFPLASYLFGHFHTDCYHGRDRVKILDRPWPLDFARKLAFI